MIKLKIISINDYEYELKDENGNCYKTSIEFYDLNQKLKTNNYIFMSEKLLDENYEEYDRFYRFGRLNSEYGRKIIDSKDNVDVIAIIINKNTIYLQRYYG